MLRSVAGFGVYEDGFHFHIEVHVRFFDLGGPF